MSEITRGVISMSFDMAMECELSRRQFHAVAQDLLRDFDRVTAERDALQQRLNAADQRVDELTPQAGWKLVPIQPTAEMLSAIGPDAKDPALAQAHAAQHWAAMIEAVPSQPDQLLDHTKMIAAQSTIAQLQARIAELESGSGEPVAYADPVAFENFKNHAHKGGHYLHEWMWAHPLPSLIPLYTAPPAPVAESEDFPPCDYCGTVPDYHPWHGAGLINGKESPHIHACTECRHKLPSPVSVVLPNRADAYTGSHDAQRGWNDCLDATAALNTPK